MSVASRALMSLHISGQRFGLEKENGRKSSAQQLIDV